MPVLVHTPAQRKVDCLAAAMVGMPPAECPVVHRFTPGIYAREIFMPTGSLVVSRVHKTEHPFVVLTGRALVWTEEAGILELTAGHVGITKSGTRRVLLITEDCRWITFHPTSETDLVKLQDELTETPDVSYAAGDREAETILEQLKQAAGWSIEAPKV